MRTAQLESACVKKFAASMRRKLKENRYKGGWREECMTYLLDKLREEVDELIEAVLADNADRFSIEAVIDEAADVGNMAMMIADRYPRQYE